MTSLTVTNARKQLYNLLDIIAKSHEPIHISGKRNSGVLISDSDWQAIQETLYLSSIPSLKKSIIKGLKTPIQKCKKEIEW